MSTIIEHSDKWVQTRTQAILAIPVPFGSGGTAKSGVDLSLLDITITPIKANNKIELEYVVFGMQNNGSFTSGFVLRRNGVNLASTTDVSDNYYAINGINVNTGSVATGIPQAHIVRLVDNLSLDVPSTYTIAVRHTSSNQAASTNFYFNRSADAPADSAETGVSTAIITEFDQ